MGIVREGRTSAGTKPGVSSREFGRAEQRLPEMGAAQPVQRKQVAAPRTIEELMGIGAPSITPQDPNAPLTVEQVLANAQAKQQAAEAVENFPSFARNVGTGAAGVGAGLATGGMSFIPALLIEAGAMAATDFGLKAAGVKREDEPGAGSFEGALNSAGVGASTLIAGGVLRSAFQGLGLLGGVGVEGLEAAARRGPIDARRFLSTAPRGAELRQARAAGEFSVEKLRNPKFRSEAIQKAEETIDKIDELYKQHAPLRARAYTLNRPRLSQPAGEAEALTEQTLGAARPGVTTTPFRGELPASGGRLGRSGEQVTEQTLGARPLPDEPVPGSGGLFTQRPATPRGRIAQAPSGRGGDLSGALTNRSTAQPAQAPMGGRPVTGFGGEGVSSEMLGGAAPRRGIVDTAPFKMFIRGMKKPAYIDEIEPQNAALDAMADSLPESMTLREFTNYIRGLNKTVGERFGQLTGVPINTANRKIIAHHASIQRDHILGEGGAALFKASSRQIEILKNFRNRLMKKDGTLKDNAPAIWRGILNKKNSLTRDTFGEFEKLTGIPVRTQAEHLAKRRQWDAPDEKVAVFMMSIIARVIRGVSRTGARGQLKFPLTNPKFGPVALTTGTNIFADQFAAKAGAGAIELTGAAIQGTSGFAKDQFMQAFEAGKNIIQHRKDQRQREADKSGF